MTKIIWSVLMVLIVGGLILFGTIGVSVTPIKVEKEIILQPKS